MNINQQLNEGQREAGGAKTSYFKFKSGDNRLRILTAGEVMSTHFLEGNGTVKPSITPDGMKASVCYGWEKGCPFHGDNAPVDKNGKEKMASTKYTCYVVDINDPEKSVQLADLPYSVTKQIGDLQDNVDYSFTDFPIPYDVTIKFNKELSPTEMYKVIPSPKREPVSDEIMAKLAEEMSLVTPQDHVAKKKRYEIKNHQEKGIWISPKKATEIKKKWRQKANEENEKKIESGEIKSEPAVEYPVNEIDPADIPF